jgi:LmbE family N-acetylglucosaminyl deacetylase
MVESLQPRRVLAIGAHPDDIEIGCSGTLLKMADMGSEVFIYIATKGERGGKPKVRVQEGERSAQRMSTKKLFWGGFIDCEVPHTVELIESIEKAVQASTPDLLLVHYSEDTHQDHRALASAAQSAARRVPNFLFYESPTTLHFSPSVYCNIESTITRKIELLETHFSQVARTNIEGLPITDIARASAIRRGIEVFCRYAEAFVPTRMMLK